MHRAPMPPQPAGQGQGDSRSRAPMWIAVACAGMVALLLLLVVTGGVTYLIVRPSGGEETEDPQPTAVEGTLFEHELFTVIVPPQWEILEIEADNSTGIVLDLQGEPVIGEDDEVIRPTASVYAFEGSMGVAEQCRFDTISFGFVWGLAGGEADDPVDIGPSELAGRETIHYRVTGTAAGMDALGEMMCLDVDGTIVTVSAEVYELEALPEEVTGMWASWEWTEAAG